MRKWHQIILQEYGLEVLHLLRDWKKLQLRDSDYKNHRIFTLRCIHKDLVPVSIKLKTTIKTDKVKKIIRNAERNLLQARVKAINNILDNVDKQTELCRSKIASILPTQRFRECQSFIAKLGEFRFNKVKQRQLNKFNNLQKRKEIWLGYLHNLALLRQAGRFPPSWGECYFPGSQHSPPWSGFPGRQAGSHLLRDSTASEAVSAISRRKQFSGFSAGSQASPPRDSSSSQASSAVPPTFLQGKVLPRWVLTPHLRQAGRQWLSQVVRQFPTFPGTVLLPRQVLQFPLTFLKGRFFPGRQ